MTPDVAHLSPVRQTFPLQIVWCAIVRSALSVLPVCVPNVDCFIVWPGELATSKNSGELGGQNDQFIGATNSIELETAIVARY